MARWNTLSGAPPRIIAHRGASGYRPEHTLEAYRLAIAQGADAIVPDLVASRDGVLFARHDLGLARSTDIAARPEFAARRRAIAGVEDWWIGDFDAAELDTLRARQPLPARGTQYDDHFIVPRFSHLLDLVGATARQCGAPIVIDAEIKQPAYFDALGIDLLAALERELAPRGLTGPQAPVWLECFDHVFLRRVFERCGNPVYALCETLPADTAARDAALRDLARWARGVAPAKSLLWEGLNKSPCSCPRLPVPHPHNPHQTLAAQGFDRPLDSRGLKEPRLHPPFVQRFLWDNAEKHTGLVAAAHAQGLEVHAWTFRDDWPSAPFATPRAELEAAFALGVDALFCDFPDRALAARETFRAAR